MNEFLNDTLKGKTEGGDPSSIAAYEYRPVRLCAVPL